MSQELNEITAIYQSLASLLKRIELLYKRISELERESNVKDELIERLRKELAEERETTQELRDVNDDLMLQNEGLIEEIDQLTI